MSRIVDEVIKANEKYAAGFGYGYSRPWLYHEVTTGRLVEVPEATAAGKVR